MQNKLFNWVNYFFSFAILIEGEGKEKEMDKLRGKEEYILITY